MKKTIVFLLILSLMMSIVPAAFAVPVPEEVREEMYRADFWLSPDRPQSYGAAAPIMSAEQIAAFNDANRAMLDLGNGVSLALEDMGEYISGDLVRLLLSFCRWPDNYDKLYVNGMIQPQPYWDALSAALAYERVPDQVQVRFGYSLVRDDLRLFPTGDFAGVTADEKLYDKLVMSEFMPFLPLAVLHESADGNWYYVAMYGFCGWIEKENVGLCRSREDWLSRMKNNNVLVVTGREIRLPEDPYCPALSGLSLPMGTAMPLAMGDEELIVGRRRGYGCHTVVLPTRGEDGYIIDQLAFVPLSEDVSVGYLPYTAENELRLAFKFLGDRYGWAGMFSSNDCSGLIHQVFACFGFCLPRTAGAIMEVQGFSKLDLAPYSPEEKLIGLESCPAGTLLGFPGHIMVYLGSVEGRAYVLSATGSFGPSRIPEGYDYSVNGVCVNSLANTRRKTGLNWLESLDSALMCVNGSLW